MGGWGGWGLGVLGGLGVWGGGWGKDGNRCGYSRGMGLQLVVGFIGLDRATAGDGGGGGSVGAVIAGTRCGLQLG